MNDNLQSILLIEDGEEDFEALTRALAKVGIHNPLFRFSHGESALDFLRGRGRYFKPGSTSRPSLVLLDLNLPNADGRHVLSEIKSNPQLKSIPVIVLTGSRSPADIEYCYRAGANSYLLKPPTIEGFVEIFRHLKSYWFDLVLLPTPEAGATDR
jgi:CheY-like chemotaxis protein